MHRRQQPLGRSDSKFSGVRARFCKGFGACANYACRRQVGADLSINLSIIGAIAGFSRARGQIHSLQRQVELRRAQANRSLGKPLECAYLSAVQETGFELLVRGRVKLVVGRRRQRKSNGSTTPLSMRIGDLRSARTPHEGRRGKDIVVLDRWAEDRTEDAVSSLARSRPVSVL